MSPWLITTTGWSWIVDAAIHGSVGALRGPAEIVAALALTVGISVGCGAAVTRELTDTAIHSPGDLEALLDAPVFAAIPDYYAAEAWYRRLLPTPSRSLLTLEASAEAGFEIPVEESPFLEALHRLRAALLLSHSNRAPQVITITDSRSQDVTAGAHHTDHAP